MLDDNGDTYLTRPLPRFNWGANMIAGIIWNSIQEGINILKLLGRYDNSLQWSLKWSEARRGELISALLSLDQTQRGCLQASQNERWKRCYW